MNNNILIVYDGVNFGEFLKEFRTYMSLTQIELCERMSDVADGLSYSSIRSYEQGKSVPKYPYDIIKHLKEEFKYDIMVRGVDIGIHNTERTL